MSYSASWHIRSYQDPPLGDVQESTTPDTWFDADTLVSALVGGAFLLLIIWQVRRGVLKEHGLA